MNVLTAHLRAELRHRWPAWAAAVLLIGVVGGMVLASVAGARRTDSAFGRMVEETNAADVLVNPNEGGASELQVEQVEALPGVRSVGVGDGGVAALFRPDGQLDGRGAIVLAQRDPDMFVNIDRPRVVEGRIFDPTDAGQIMVTDDVADDYGVEPGDTLTVGTIDVEEYMAWEDGGREGPEPIQQHDLTLTAVVITAESVVEDEAFSFGAAFLTQAFAVENELEPFFFGMAVDLVDGSDAVPAFQDAVRSLVPGEVFEFKTLAAVTETVERGAHPHVVALLAFAGVVGVAGLVVVGQVLARQNTAPRADITPLRALGVTRRELRLAAGLRATAIAAAGAVVAVAVAAAVSPLFPLGIARRAEVSPGFDVDPAVLGLGAIAIVVALLTWSAPGIWRIAAPARSRGVRNLGALERLARSASSPVTSTGVRAAISPPGGTHAGPARAALAGLAVAVAAVVGAMTFGASLVQFVTSPSSYGWPWDAVVALPNDDPEVADEVLERIERSVEFGGARHLALTVDQVALDGVRVPAVGILSGEGPGLTIVAGRSPDGPGEVALGGRTMDRLGVGVGDRIIAGDIEGGMELTVVGQAVFPGIGTYSGADRTEVGKGAVLDAGTLAEVGEGFGFRSVVLDAADPAAVDSGLASITAGYEPMVEEGSIEIEREPQRPSDVLNLERVRGTPTVISAVLATLAGAAFAFVLVSGVRSRRRELALLKTFGFRGRDVAGTVIWQSSLTAVIALVVGIPLGIAAGRQSWAALADALGIDPEVRVPLAVLAVPVVVLLLANLVAVVPGAIAARTRPALALRSE